MIPTRNSRSVIDRITTIFISLISCCLLACSVVGQQDNTDVDELDLIHFGDVIDVDFVGSIEYDWRGTIGPDGALLGLNEIEGPINAHCRNPRELATEIERVFSVILRSPEVNVTIVDKSARPHARIDGAIKNAAKFSIRRRSLLSEIIARAGGLTDDAGGDIEIIRPARLSCSAGSGNDGTSWVINISDLLRGEAGSDPVIYGGDMIEVRRATPIYVLGAVEVSRSLIFRPGMSLQKALDAVGGRTKNADPGRIVVLRRDSQGVQTIVIKATDPKKGIFPDEILQVFDIIVVPSRGESDVKFPPVFPGQPTLKPDGDLPLVIIEDRE